MERRNVINLSEYYQHNGRMMKVTDIDGILWTDFGTIGTDYETDKNFVDIKDPGKNYITEIFEDEIKSIEVLE